MGQACGVAEHMAEHMESGRLVGGMGSGGALPFPASPDAHRAPWLYPSPLTLALTSNPNPNP